MNTPLGPYEPDAVLPAARLVVELDSYGIHITRQAFESDRQRDRALLGKLLTADPRPR